jgi:molecular chaperone GrpE
LRDQLQEAQQRALRLGAELDNFRKRSFREMEDQRKYASLPLMRDLLPVVDNLDRAIQAAEQSESSTGLLEGVSMVAQHLHSVLDQHGCKRIEAKGSLFDPNLHEAIGQLHCSEFPAGTVAEATTVGYELHGRVVRPSQVFVSLGPAEDKPADEDSD